MLDVIAIGNATMDVFVHVHPRVFKGNISFVPGSKVDVEDVDFFTGGGASNVSVGLARLGLKAGVVAMLGNDPSSRVIVDEFRKEGVSTRLLGFSKKNRTAYSVILTGFGRDRVVLTYKGSTQELATGLPVKLGRLRSKWIYVSSFHSSGESLKKIFLHAQKNKAKIAFNPGSLELRQGMEKFRKLADGIDVLLMNASEALSLTGSTDIERNLHVLSRIAKIVVITDGAHGVHATDGLDIYSKKPFPVDVLDTTGAGDAFNAGFVAALVHGKTIEDAIDWGMANSNSVIQYLGTKNILLTQQGMKKFLSKFHGNKTVKKNMF